MSNPGQTKKQDISSDTQSRENTESRSRTLSDEEIELLRAQKRRLVEEAIKRNSKNPDK